jgi:hypothetical protein
VPAQGTKTIHRNKGATRHPRRYNGINGNWKEEEPESYKYLKISSLHRGAILFILEKTLTAALNYE